MTMATAIVAWVGGGFAIMAAQDAPPIPPSDYIWSVIVFAAANPLVWLCGFFMGKKIDQWQKLLVIGFASAAVGLVCMWLLMAFEIVTVYGYSGTGVFILQMLIGMLAGAVGFMTTRGTTEAKGP